MKKIYLLIPLFFILVGCNQEVTEQDLIGGNWIATAGYQDGEIEGDPSCYPFQDGIAFRDDDTVYVEAYERDFEYWFGEDDDGSEAIWFNDSGPGLYSYQIQMMSEDEMVLRAMDNLQDGQSCYMERK